MDLPELKRNYYKGITYQLSDLFDTDYGSEYTLSTDADTRILYEINVNFSVESFTADEAEAIAYEFDNEIDNLNAVHDNYVLKRQKSLFASAVSIKKEVPKSVGYPGYIQVIHGDPYGEEMLTSYFTATLDVEGKYFVFQMIGKRDNMGYLYDDFIDILSSVNN